MPAQVKPEWVTQLQALCGPEAFLRFNWLLHRWEFGIPGADGVVRSQFWGEFWAQTRDGQRVRVPVDPATGLPPYRDLDDAAMREALDNLTRSFVGNPWDGAGSPRKEIERRMRHNHAAGRAHYRRLGEEWADRFLDRVKRMRGEPLIPVEIDLKRSA